MVTSGLKWLANADTVVEHLKQMLQNSEKGTSVSKYYRKCKIHKYKVGKEKCDTYF